MGNDESQHCILGCRKRLKALAKRKEAALELRDSPDLRDASGRVDYTVRTLNDWRVKVIVLGTDFEWQPEARN